MATLKELREERNFSQEELATRALIALRTVARVEAGEPVNRNTVKRLAEVLGVSVDVIEGVTYSSRHTK